MHVLFTLQRIGLGRAFRAQCVSCEWVGVMHLSREAAAAEHSVHRDAVEVIFA